MGAGPRRPEGWAYCPRRAGTRCGAGRDDGRQRPFGLVYWPLPEDDPACESARVDAPRVARRRARAWPAVDAARGTPWKTAVDPLAPARRLQRALRLPAARGRGLRRARVRHALHEQRHRLPARVVHRRRRDRRTTRCAGAAPRRSCCSATAAADPDGDGAGASSASATAGSASPRTPARACSCCR